MDVADLQRMQNMLEQQKVLKSLLDTYFLSVVVDLHAASGAQNQDAQHRLAAVKTVAKDLLGEFTEFREA